MITKHFFKILMIFMLMIGIGLLGLFLLENYNQRTTETTNANTPAPVAN